MSEVFSLHSQSYGGLPCLTLAGADAPADAPTALVLHGLNRHKESTLPILYAFARCGLPNPQTLAPGTGGRPGGDVREHRLEGDYVGTMAEIIEGTSHDLSLLLDALGVSRAAVHGVSLGGYIAFAAMADDPRFAVGAVAMGSPDWLEPLRAAGLAPGHPLYDAIAVRSPLERAALFPPRPLLMLHGDQDSTVSIHGVLSLHAALLPLYQATPERLELRVYPGLDHFYTDDMMQRAAEWTAHWLRLQ